MCLSSTEVSTRIRPQKADFARSIASRLQRARETIRAADCGGGSRTLPFSNARWREPALNTDGRFPRILMLPDSDDRRTHRASARVGAAAEVGGSKNDWG